MHGMLRVAIGVLMSVVMLAGGTGAFADESDTPIPVRPDLIVAGLYEIEDGPYSMRIVVRNQGTALAGPFHVVATDPSGNPVGVFFLTGLARGQSKSLLIPWQNWCDKTTVKVDMFNKVLESNELNNIASINAPTCPK